MKNDILLIEANLTDQQLIEDYVSRFKTQFSIHSCPSIGDGLAWLKENNPAVVLVDLTLPDSLDLNTLSVLSEIAQKLPVIILSGYEDDHIAIESIKKGFQDFLRKGEFDQLLLEKTVLFAVERSSILKRLDLANQNVVALNTRLEEIVSERTRELEESKKELVKYLNIRENFIRNITHEVRTPLTGILGAIQLLEGKKVPQDLTVIFKILHDSSIRIHHFFESVLDYTLTQSDGILLINEPFNLQELLNDIGHYIAQIKLHPEVIPSIFLQANQHIRLLGDSYHIIKLVKYLVDNAVRYTKTGNITITYSVRKTDHTAHLEFEVSNTGEQLQPNQIHSLMMPFIQGGEKTREFHGAGLGLTLAKKLSEMMRGQLAFRYDPVKGNVFTSQITLDIV